MEQTADELRGLIGRRRAFMRKSAEFWQWLEDSQAGTAPGVRRAVYRCDRHKGGKSPKLAETALVHGHLVFKSRIDTTARDRVEPPPWQVEHLLGGAVCDMEWQRFQSDDGDLLRYAESVKHPKGDMRWLVPSREFPTWLQYAIPLTDPASPVGMWIRCKDHPDDAEQLAVERLFSDLR